MSRRRRKGGEREGYSIDKLNWLRPILVKWTGEERREEEEEEEETRAISLPAMSK